MWNNSGSTKARFWPAVNEALQYFNRTPMLAPGIVKERTRVPNSIDDMLETKVKIPKPTVSSNRTFSGELHKVLSRGLPDYCDENGVMMVGRLAAAMQLRTQTVYKWMRVGFNHQIPKFQIDRIIELSKVQWSGGNNFKPLQIQDLWPFVSGYERHKGTGKKKNRDSR